MNKNILQQVDKLVQDDGLHQTYLEGVKLFKTSTYSYRVPLLYDHFCLILVLQGKKIGYLTNTTFHYDTKNYLVIPASLPFECETIASEGKPYICMLISMDKTVMYELITTLEKQENNDGTTTSLALFSDDVTLDIEDITLRLLKILESKEESNILGKQLLRELFYRIAIGENSQFLHKMFLNSNTEAKISRSLKTIHDKYNEHFDIPSLAKKEDMSVSSFHTHFKKITSYTPLQYIKKIRLNKARYLIAIDEYQVNETAFEIGYESSSQFSRDFKSYFGYPPKEAKASFEKYSLI
ncbi:AraC family transcriptional regulator [Sulfurospirillum arcachonense]|uniref:AraC family transcriptional regulator n=1 Tax=Sulfurospirillum arcachonense TaxID=57666 RepID=UPI000469A5B3|nr:AraC family transcriptional regulator [Sulfurospirillum arcachonense]